MCGSRGGGGGTGGPAPLKNHKKYRVSKQYWSGSSEKSQSYQASIQCWANIGTPAKRRFAGEPMMAHLKWYLDPFFPHQLKKSSGPLWKNFLDPCMVQRVFRETYQTTRKLKTITAASNYTNHQAKIIKEITQGYTSYKLLKC